MTFPTLPGRSRVLLTGACAIAAMTGGSLPAQAEYPRVDTFWNANFNDYAFDGWTNNGASIPNQEVNLPFHTSIERWGACAPGQSLAVNCVMHGNAGITPDGNRTTQNAYIEVDYYNSSYALLGTDKQPMVPWAFSGYAVNAPTPVPTNATQMRVVIGRDTDTVGGTVFVDDVKVSVVNVLPAPTLDQTTKTNFEKRIWAGGQQYNETVTMTPDGFGSYAGKLMYTPNAGTVSVTSFGRNPNVTGTISEHSSSQADPNRTYVNGTDYTVNGKTITLTAGSAIPKVENAFFGSQYSYTYYDLILPPSGDNQLSTSPPITVVVSYSTNDTSAAPVAYAGGTLSNTMSKLGPGKTLKILALGDSITYGTGTSNAAGVSPFMPTWLELFRDSLNNKYGGVITCVNDAIGGLQTNWAVTNAAQYVAIEKPDLVLIGFGTNDAGSLSANAYENMIFNTIQSIHQISNPDIILVAPMRSENNYYIAPRESEYETALYHIAQWYGYTNVAVAPMYTVTNNLYGPGGPKDQHDCLANPLHPNDWTARWFAQVLEKMLDPN